VAVSGDGTSDTPNPQFKPTAAGTYHWVAVYSGDSPNTNSASHNTDCTDQNEDVLVSTVASTLSRAQNWLPNDSVTVSAPAGSGDLDGTVSFDLYASADCSGTAIYSTTAEVAGASPETVSTSNTTVKATASGSYSWKVSYDSDPSAHRDIPASCEETSSLTIDNGDCQKPLTHLFPHLAGQAPKRPGLTRPFHFSPRRSGDSATSTNEPSRSTARPHQRWPWVASTTNRSIPPWSPMH
jgi:hypothetical protein